jgi:ATP-binding cassette subfamily B protein
MMHTMGRYGSALDEKLGAAYNRRIVLRLLGHVRPYIWLAVLSTIAMLVYSFTAVASPWIIQRTVDSVVTDGDSRLLGLFALLLLANALLGYLANFIHLMTLSNVGQKVLLDLRTSLFNHLQELSMAFFDRREVGETMSRVQNDVQSLQEYLSIFILAIGDLVTLGGIVVAMLLMDWQLGLITLVVLPFLMLSMLGWQRRAWQSFAQVRRRQAAVNAGLQENITGIRVIQSLHRTNENTARFIRTNQEFLNSGLKASRLAAALPASVDIITALAIGMAMFFGGSMVLRGDLAIGVLVAFAMYIHRFFDPIRSLVIQYSQLQRAMTAGERIFELMDTRPAIVDRPDAIPMPPIRGEIEFQNVHFSYVPDVPVLKDINLHVRPGEQVALVGATGAGKSTLVSLIPRLYDVTQGRVLIDGYDVRDVVRSSLNRQVTMVLQEPFLFSGTIRDNIRYCHPEATAEEVEAIARLAGAHEFIMRLEKGYDTQMQERGLNLSTGQRQLVSLARALLSNPRIVILDEATATIDSHTEKLVQSALETLLRGRTSLVIAHRLSTVRTADRIVVLADGGIIEQGEHNQLLAQGGTYARLYQTYYQVEEVREV